MKRYLIYILLIISSICYGQIYSTTNSNIHNNFRSTSYYNQSTRGYNNSYNNVNYNNSKFGYTTSGGLQKFSYNTFNNNEYIADYNPVSYENEIMSRPGPRRAPGDHASGSETVTVDGCIATISWDVNADFLGWFFWTITYSDGTTESFTGTFNNAKAHAKQVAEDKARVQAEKMAQNPGDPYADPISEFPIGLLLILSFGYLYYRKYKNIKLMLQKS